MSSERGSVSQIVDGTSIEVNYGRPRLRGRIAFGGVVHWGEMWTPGANFATTIRFGKDVTFSGRPVPAGRYSVWIVPTELAWTVYLHRNPRLYHLQRPRPEEMLVGVPVTPVVVPATELLTFSFPEVRRDRTTLELRWGDRAFSLEIQVSPTAAKRRRLARSEVAAYLGRYTAWVFAEHGDSTEMRQQLVYEDGRLKGLIGDGKRTFELIPTGKSHQFWFELHDETGPYDIELASPVVFTLDRAGRATGFRLKGIEQPLWMRGIRAPE